MRAVAFAVVVAAVACGGGASRPDPFYARSLGPTRVEPSNDLERAILARIEGLPSGEAVSVEGHEVVADAPYAAASGLTCRRVRIGSVRPAPATREKLACRDASGWFYAPDVLGPAAVRSESP